MSCISACDIYRANRIKKNEAYIHREATLEKEFNSALLCYFAYIWYVFDLNKSVGKKIKTQISISPFLRYVWITTIDDSSCK